MDPKKLAEQLAALEEYVLPAPPTPPPKKTNDDDPKNHDDDEDQNETPLTKTPSPTYAQQIALLEKQLGWDKDDDEKDINDQESLNEYLTAKKNFSKEVNEYMKEISGWRNNNNNQNRHADPGFKQPLKEENEVEEREDEEEKEKEVNEPPTKSVATASVSTKKPKTKKSLSTTTKKSSNSKRSTSTRKPMENNINNNPALTPIKKPTKQETTSNVLSSSTLTTTTNLPHHHHHHHMKLPPRKAPITFTELTKAVLKNNNTTSTFSVDNAEALADALEQVTRIDFTNRGLTDLDAFDCVPSITHAYLGDNHIKSLDGCEIWLDCQVLVLHDNEISCIPQLFALRNLRFLDLKRNKLLEDDVVDDDHEDDPNEILTRRFISFLPETLESLEIEGNEYFIKKILFLADDGRDEEQGKENFWVSCLARCPNLTSIDVIGTRQEMEEKMRIKLHKVQEEPISNILLLENKNEQDDDDDDDDDDPMLHKSSMNENFVEPMPDEATFAASLKQRMIMNSRNGNYDFKNDHDVNESDDDDDDNDQEVDEVKFKPEGDGLQARITDADFDEDTNNNNNNEHLVRHENRPASARGNTTMIRPGSARGQKKVVGDCYNDDNDNNNVRLRLPITDNLQSNVRSVTDDLLRQYENVRRNAEAAENSRANHIDENNITNNNKINVTARQVIDDASRNAEATQDSIEELRSESRDLCRELIFAAQHQARVASLRVDDMWNDGVEEFKKELENSLQVRRNADNSSTSGGIFSNNYNNNNAKLITPKNIFGDDGDENPFMKMKKTDNELIMTTERPQSSAYLSALRVLANRSHTTVEGLEKYRKPIEKK